MATIGYGVSDYYFGGCWTPLLMVLMQVCTAILFDACAVGLLFTRLSRGRKRGKSIVVSNQAVVQVVQGVPFFMFRVGELRRFPLINASVRLYCIRHERLPRINPSAPTVVPFVLPKASASSPTGYQDLASVARESAAKSAGSSSRVERGAKKGTTPSAEQSRHSNNTKTKRSPSASSIPIETTHYVTRAMKILHTDESLMHSNHILMSLPQVVVHRMDAASPLMPPSEWYDARGRKHIFPHNKDNLLDIQAQIEQFWMDRGVEIVVLVEGTDELTGAAIQTRHSYSTSPPPAAPAVDNSRSDQPPVEGDVQWNRAFASCISLTEADPEQGYQQRWSQYTQHPVCTVDFSRFHDVVPTPRNCFASPHVPFATSL